MHTASATLKSATLKLTRFEHTDVALSFALVAAFTASSGWPRSRTLLLILLAVVGARTAALAFRGAIGRRDDPEAPPIAEQGPSASGALWAVVGAAAAAYFLAAALLNRLCLLLSPLALVALIGCVYARRLTVWGHWIVGFCVGLAPVGAWIAIVARLDPAALILGAAAGLWTAGFDIVHACRTVEFHRAGRFLSLPARWGASKALVAAAGSHLAAVWLLALFGEVAGLGWLYLLGVVVLIPPLYLAHRLVRPEQPSTISTVSIFANGALNIALLLFAAADAIFVTGRIHI